MFDTQRIKSDHETDPIPKDWDQNDAIVVTSNDYKRHSLL